MTTNHVAFIQTLCTLEGDLAKEAILALVDVIEGEVLKIEDEEPGQSALVAALLDAFEFRSQMYHDSGESDEERQGLQRIQRILIRYKHKAELLRCKAAEGAAESAHQGEEVKG
jgi:hypothetical protein